MEDNNLLLEPSYKSPPTTYKPCTFIGPKLVSCVIGLIVLCILLSNVHITIVINLKEKQLSVESLSVIQTVTTRLQTTRPTSGGATTVKLSGASVVGDLSTECQIKSNDVLEIITHSSEGGCAIPFEQLKLPITKSLTSQVLEFDMEFLFKPYGEPSGVIGRHGGIYYGNHSFDRFINGNTIVDWIDRTSDRGYRFYQSELDHNCSILLPKTKEPVSHLQIVIKSNGEHIVIAEDEIWKNLTGSAVHLLDKPYLGFWAYNTNYLRISNFTIRPYIENEFDGWLGRR